MTGGESRAAGREDQSRSASPIDYRAARTCHPESVALDATVQVAAVLPFFEEDLEGVEEGRKALSRQPRTVMTGWDGTSAF